MVEYNWYLSSPQTLASPFQEILPHWLRSPVFNPQFFHFPQDSIFQCDILLWKAQQFPQLPEDRLPRAAYIHIVHKLYFNIHGQGRKQSLLHPQRSVKAGILQRPQK